MIHGKRYAGVTPDPFAITAEAGDHTDTTGRTVSTLALTPGENTGIILAYGDSFGANSSVSAYSPASSKLDQVNILDHVCYRLTDPTLGVTNEYGNVVTRLGKKLLDSSTFSRVIVINCCRGGATINDFTRNGAYNNRLRVALWCTRLLAQPVTAVIQFLGANDSAISQANWESYFSDIRQFIRGHGCNAPIYVTKSSYVSGSNVSAIRAAQDAVVDSALGVRAGPDIDPPVIPAGERTGDGLHPDDTGQNHFATLYHDILAADF